MMQKDFWEKIKEPWLWRNFAKLLLLYAVLFVVGGFLGWATGFFVVWIAR